MYIKAATDVKKISFLEKNGGGGRDEAVDHEMAL